jgi:hypothetical protein
MEELLPLESYHAQSELVVRRAARLAGAAFGLVLGSAMGVGIASALDPMTGLIAGVVTAGLTGGVFSAVWGSSMLRMRHARNERAYENDPKLMGESLEDSFRYRMPCALVDGRRLVDGTLYLDRGRAAFVPMRKLARTDEAIELALESSPFDVVSWGAAPAWVRFAHGGEPRILRVGGVGQVLGFLAPDPDLALTRLRNLLPARSP